MKYDRSIKMYDEGYTPLQLEELTKKSTKKKKYNNSPKGKKN